MSSKFYHHCLGLLVLGLAAASPAAVARSLGGLEFKPCSLAMAMSPDTVSAQCATLKVPENPADRSGRQISLALAWIPANGEAEPDPVFMIAGGPGQSALESYPQLHQAFAEVRKKRHVILVDQRGTGGSNKLICKDETGKSAVMENEAAPDLAQAQLFAKKCALELGARADTRFYSTEYAIQDLELVRQKIGVATVNLYGVSYGTRVAQQFAKRYPNSVRTLVLDGIAPNSMVLGTEHAKNLEAALDLHFARCTLDKVCKAKMGNPRAVLTRLRAQLEKAPMVVTYADPISGEYKQEKMSVGHLANVVRMFSYSPMTAAMLPLVLSEASKGNAGPLMAQSAMLSESLGDSIMHGMQLSVICSEDAPDYKTTVVKDTSLLGNMMVEYMAAQCKVWPSAKRPADFREPLKSKLPVLLLSGEFDPVTPPRYGNEVAGFLPNSKHVVVKGQGHNVMPVGCGPKIFAKFIDGKNAKNLDTRCLDSLAYVSPFTGFYGWEP